MMKRGNGIRGGKGKGEREKKELFSYISTDFK
jgi:hypothetical protein